MNFGESTCTSPGDGGSSGELRIQHFHRLSCRPLPGELEEDLLQSAAARGLRAQIVNRSHGANLSLLDDRDAVAQRLSNLEGVRRHHDGMPALHVLPEKIL